MNSSEIWPWGRAPRRPRTSRKRNQWVLEQVKPETSLEANDKTALYCFRHIVTRQGSLGKTIMQENRRQQGKKKTKQDLGRLPKRSYKLSLQELSKAAGDRTL